MKSFFGKIFGWFNMQLEWAKGFFEEEIMSGRRKPSQKRLISFLTSITFLYSYFVILVRRTEMVQKLSDITLPDIPPMWATLIGFIIGANILGNSINNKQVLDSKQLDIEKIKEEAK